MREILFRGIPKSDIDRHFFADIWKDNCEGSFVYGSLIIDKDRYYICVSAMCKINCCINNGMTSMIEVIPETVGQYTGLTDKNGKKIFDGDIVKAEDDYIFVVNYGKCGGVANAENFGYMGFYFDGFDEITKGCISYGLRNDICYFTNREVILKPCPFCGGTNLRYDRYWCVNFEGFYVRCLNCDASATPKGTKRAARKAWNTRTHDFKE